jgi:hypothetical protein
MTRVGDETEEMVWRMRSQNPQYYQMPGILWPCCLHSLGGIKKEGGHAMALQAEFWMTMGLPGRSRGPVPFPPGPPKRTMAWKLLFPAPRGRDSS